MIAITPSAFLDRFCAPFTPQEHHYTGPLLAQLTPGHGSVFPLEGRILACFAAEHGGPALEIGSDYGVSSRYIREGLDVQDPTTRLFCVDILHKWDSYVYDERIEQYHTDAAHFSPPEHCKWAFIDGDHRYDAVVADIHRCAELGIYRLLFHDTSPTIEPAEHASKGSDARRAVIDALTSGWDLYDIDTPCGMIYADRH